MANAGSKTSSDNLAARVVAALVLGAIVVFAIAMGGLFFATIVAVFAVAGLHEWLALTRGSGAGLWRFAILSALALALALIHLDAPVAAVAVICAVLLLHLILGKSRSATTWLALGYAWQFIPAAALIHIRAQEPSGLLAIALILFSVWATDTAAYIGGRTIGGAKLWPRISPNKTWAGALSGLCAALAVGAIFAGLAPAGGVFHWIAAAAALSVGAQFGDLFESRIKRQFGVKDSGRLIPGHGGVLDRTDGASGAAILALLISWGWFGAPLQGIFGGPGA